MLGKQLSLFLLNFEIEKYQQFTSVIIRWLEDNVIWTNFSELPKLKIKVPLLGIEPLSPKIISSHFTNRAIKTTCRLGFYKKYFYVQSSIFNVV